MISQIVAAHPGLDYPIVAFAITVLGVIGSVGIAGFAAGVLDASYFGRGTTRFSRLLQIIPSYAFGEWLASDGEIF